MTDQGRKSDEKDLRRDRLKAALRENLRRRKTQARQRGETTQAPSGGQETSPHRKVGGSTD
jgi:hypothetical protein